MSLSQCPHQARSIRSATTVPQTRSLPVDERLPRLFGSTVHSGLLIAAAVLVLIHLMMTRTAFGLKLQVLGANRAAAIHAGERVGTPDRPRFCSSAA